MKIQIRSRSIQLNDGLKRYITRRIHFALGRFARRVKDVRVMLQDLNGPKGGTDKHCKVIVDIHPRIKVVIEESDAELLAAINRALDRAGRNTARRLDKALGMDRSGRSALRRIDAYMIPRRF